MSAWRLRLLAISSSRFHCASTCTAPERASSGVLFRVSLYFIAFISWITRTDSLVMTLSMYAINTSLMTSILFAVCFITYATMPDNLVAFGFFFPISKFYLNAALATLNARSSLRERFTGSSMTMPSISFPDSRMAGSTARSGTSSRVDDNSTDLETPNIRLKRESALQVTKVDSKSGTASFDSVV